MRSFGEGVRGRLRKRSLANAAALALATLAGVVSCRRGAPEQPAQATRAQHPHSVLESIYDGGLKQGWLDGGWAPRNAKGPGPASVSFTQGGGWIVSKPSLDGQFGALVFQMKPPLLQPEFLEVHLDGPGVHVFPKVTLRSEHRLDIGQGWIEVVIRTSELNPNHWPYDRVVFRATRPVVGPAVLFDKIGLTPFDPSTEVAQALAEAKPARMRIDCTSAGRRIDPRIYGISYYAMTDKEPGQWALEPTMRRWGGNTTSRYNWELGDAWNTGKDWFWENVEAPSYTVFLRDNASHGVTGALTVPTIGWVAKDKTSFSFSTDLNPNQEQTDAQWRPTAGNGRKDGKDLPPPDPTTTSVPAPPEFIGRWVQAIRAADAETATRSVDIYILDNESGLWHENHRDVHPLPVGYDELLDRTLRYGAAIRRADPGALIAGPAAWSWEEYFFSAKDRQARAHAILRPDRRAHGDVPLLAWYLRQLAAEEKRTGTHILDLVDVHFYPTPSGIYGNDHIDPASAALRIRSTRALWDPTYTEESYINQPVRLLPRLHAWIDENFPGRGIEIGEWNFGGETHMSGALAVAEVLGRFGQNDVAAAFYWTYPPAISPVTYAFRAFRNFDGRGGHFLNYALPTTAPEGASLFASRDVEGKHLTAVLLNFAPDRAFLADIDLASCGPVAQRQTFVYSGDSRAGFVAGPLLTGNDQPMQEPIPPYSIAVIDLQLAEPLGASVKP